MTASSSNTALLPDPVVTYVSNNSTGTLALVPVADQFGVSEVTVTVEDAGLDGIFDDDPLTGVDESADNRSVTRSFAVRVLPVNDEPTLDPLNPVTVDEDSLATTVDLAGIGAGGGETQDLRVTASSDNLALVADPTVTYTMNDATGSISFMPEPDQFGTATITVTVEDGGLDGNLNTPGDNLTFDQEFLLTVDPVNDEPVLAPLLNRTIDEDAPASNVSLTGIGAGPNETQNLRVTASSDDLTLISDLTITYTSPLDFGTLTYLPNADQFGSATITVTVEDGGDDDDLDTPGDNLTAEQSFLVTVNPINDVPTIDTIPNLTIDEDDPLQTVDLQNITAGGGESQPIAISATSSDLSLIPDPVVSYSTPDSTGSLQFAPVADAFGSAFITVTLEDGGLDLDLNTTADNGVSTETFLVTVNAVNDDPTLDLIADQTALEDSGPQTVALSGITAGADETQPLRVTATSGDPTLVSDLVVQYTSPDTDALLSYTPQPDQFGSTTITVTVEDGGLDGNLGTTGDNGFTSRDIQVTIDPVNDPPTVDDPADITIDEDSLERVVTLTGITAGENESQPLRVSASSDSPGLIPDPDTTYSSPDSTGSIAFTPVPDGFGVATITVTVEDAGLDGDFDTTADNLTFSQSFEVTVNNLDDPPSPMDDFLSTDEDSALRIDGPSLLENDEDPDLGPGSGENLSIVMPPESQSDLGATVTYNSATGEITYDPSTSTALQALPPGQSLQDFFTYAVEDADGETNPPSATVFLNVSGINDAPTVVDDVVPAPEESEPVVIRPLANDFDIDGTLDVDSIIITEEPLFGSLAKRINEGVLELAYSPFETFTGSDSFRYTISDNLGQPSGQATVTIVPSNLPRTNPDVAGGVAADNVNVPVLDNDSAVQGQLDASTVTVVTDPENGEAIPQADGSITYIPDAGFFGEDTFEYTVADTEGNVSEPTRVVVRAVESGLENPLMYADVNASGEVTALDALLVINKLATGGGQASIPVDPSDRGPNFFDVNGNMSITALDALNAINAIGQNTPLVSAEMVEQPIIADMASTAGEKSSAGRVDSALESPVAAAPDAQKIVDASLGGVDDDVVDLLAAAQDDSEDDDDEADESLAITDLAFRDLV